MLWRLPALLWSFSWADKLANVHSLELSTKTTTCFSGKDQRPNKACKFKETSLCILYAILEQAQSWNKTDPQVSPWSKHNNSAGSWCRYFGQETTGIRTSYLETSVRVVSLLVIQVLAQTLSKGIQTFQLVSRKERNKANFKSRQNGRRTLPRLLVQCFPCIGHQAFASRWGSLIGSIAKICKQKTFGGTLLYFDRVLRFLSRKLKATPAVNHLLKGTQLAMSLSVACATLLGSRKRQNRPRKKKEWKQLAARQNLDIWLHLSDGWMPKSKSSGWGWGQGFCFSTSSLPSSSSEENQVLPPKVKRSHAISILCPGVFEQLHLECYIVPCLPRTISLETRSWFCSEVTLKRGFCLVMQLLLGNFESKLSVFHSKWALRNFWLSMKS